MNLFYLLLTAFLFQPGLSLTTAIQVDLIFPKNNTIYQPVYPFPLVFAASNFAAAAQYKPAIRWTLYRFDPISRDRGSVKSGVIGWDIDNAQPNLGPQPDKYLSIDSSPAPSQTNQSNWLLEYSFFVGKSRCSVSDEDRFSRGSVGKIFFDTDRKSGAMPDIATFGPCPFTLGIVGITGQNQTDADCPLVSTPSPAPTSCAFTVDSQAFDQISKAMVDTSKCKNVTWPNGTGIGNHCDQSSTPAKNSEIKAFQWNPFTMMLSLILLAMMHSFVYSDLRLI